MKTKRFIAGAICPSCGQMDTVRIFTDQTGQQVRECVDCGFSDHFSDQPALRGELPEARISREEQALEENTDIIRIINPRPLR